MTSASVARAKEIYESSIVIDAHNDLPTRILDDGYDPAEAHAPGFGPACGETDVPRLVESGITAVFLSAFVHGRFARTPGSAHQRAAEAIDAARRLVSQHPRRLRLAHSAAEVRDAKRDGVIAILIGIEGGHAIEDSLENLRDLYSRGARYMTLTWNNGSAWAGSSVGEDGTRRGGLTAFGRMIVSEMNRLGMLVDISHVSDQTFFDVVETSVSPVIASHSNARMLTAHPRNLTDDQLRAVAASGGVVNANFYAVFVDERFRRAKSRVDERLARALARIGGSSKPEAASQRLRDRAQRQMQQIPAPALEALIDHIDYMSSIAGPAHVGLGSDFDGVHGLLPEGMRQVSDLPRIAEMLLGRGYGDDAVRGILGGNMLRVMSRVLDRAV